MTDFRTRLRHGERLIGTLLQLPSPAVVQLIVGVGFDWIFVDGEHPAIGVPEMQAMVAAAEGRCDCLVRIPALTDVWMNAAVSAGATGVIVPHVDSADDAARAVESARGRVALVVQAESQLAVASIDDIIRVAGVDAVLVGPYDLSASLGLAGQVEHPTVREAIAVVGAACRRVAMPVGIFGMTAKAVQPFAAAGFTLLVAGVDAGLLRTAATGLLQELRG